MTLDATDRLAIHELLARYGHVIDDRQWDDLGLVFTPDAVYDASDFGKAVTRSLTDLREHWTSDAAEHPVAHHATNIVVREDEVGTVRVRSKGLGVGRGGRVGSVVYEDVVVSTDDGWRISHRRATLRRG
jgi:hypothetical protein